MEAIQTRAKHGLKVIYDAAHSFEVKVNGKSIFEYGDISTTSFHATKLFHTVEGGAVITKSAEFTRKLSPLCNFGHADSHEFEEMGINGKNSELHTIMGLSVLSHISEILSSSNEQSERHKKLLKGLEINYPNGDYIEDYNHSYFPIIFQSEAILEAYVEILESNGISGRRYFMRSLNTLDYTSGDCPISEEINKKAPCLPLYDKLKQEEQHMIAHLLLRIHNNPTS